jgi:hypothetical protein
MAAGLLRPGADIEVKLAEANGLAFSALPADVAQPDTSEPTEKAPSGNMGTVARNLSAWRREDSGKWDMVFFPVKGKARLTIQEAQGICKIATLIDLRNDL